jgi:hypothetical protein
MPFKVLAKKRLVGKIQFIKALRYCCGFNIFPFPFCIINHKKTTLPACKNETQYPQSGAGISWVKWCVAKSEQAF